LKTRILSSKERAIIKRADFDIAGDSVEFDTNTHTGKLVGNVKMVITSQSQLLGNQNE
jgi:lipopolysaccharide assembly outer membrane protein LptD (OstA)